VVLMTQPWRPHGSECTNRTANPDGITLGGRDRMVAPPPPHPRDKVSRARPNSSPPPFLEASVCSPLRRRPKINNHPRWSTSPRPEEGGSVWRSPALSTTRMLAITRGLPGVLSREHSGEVPDPDAARAPFAREWTGCTRTCCRSLGTEARSTRASGLVRDGGGARQTDRGVCDVLEMENVVRRTIPCRRASDCWSSGRFGNAPLASRPGVWSVGLEERVVGTEGRRDGSFAGWVWRWIGRCVRLRGLSGPKSGSCLVATSLASTPSGSPHSASNDRLVNGLAVSFSLSVFSLLSAARSSQPVLDASGVARD